MSDIKGSVYLVDRVTGIVHGSYLGPMGSVRCLDVHPTLPVFVGVGLDRMAFVWDIKSRQRVAKIPMKTHLNVVLFTPDLSMYFIELSVICQRK